MVLQCANCKKSDFNSQRGLAIHRARCKVRKDELLSQDGAANALAQAFKKTQKKGPQGAHVLISISIYAQIQVILWLSNHLHHLFHIQNLSMKGLGVALAVYAHSLPDTRTFYPHRQFLLRTHRNQLLATTLNRLVMTQHPLITPQNQNRLSSQLV